MSLSTQSRWDIWAFSALLLAVLAWDMMGLDVSWAQWYGSAQGFALKNNALMQFWFHDVAQNSARVLFVACIVMIFFPLGFFKRLSKADRVHLVLATLLASLTVVLFKQFSKTSCPWSLELFGGAAKYVSHWDWGVSDGGGGRCFPGGHSSSGFAFIAAAFWLRSWSNKFAFVAIIIASFAGLMLGWVQQMRGAHFFSHTLWAWVLCWAVGLAYFYAVQAYRNRSRLLA